jgi:hypothetical protein
MRFQYRYYGHSTVANSASSTELRFAPDTLRAPTHFVAELNQHVPFREAISALHDVVVADQRYQARDKSAYKAWLEQQEGPLLLQFMARANTLREQIAPLQAELAQLRKSRAKLLQPFWQAQHAYFRYLYATNREAWRVFDPVITVHPDRLLFECFSRDESSWAQLSCSHNVFKQLGQFACGTTNIDYSEGLYQQFQKIRDYKTTRLEIAPDGFQVQNGADPEFFEPKIEVPESWLRGFLQVASAMNQPCTRFDLHPMDIHNFCWLLRRNKERFGPRSIRFLLTPGQPVRALFEPWNRELVCRRSLYQGEAQEVRIWGRRRLLLLERLIPLAHSFSVFLTGSGMPSFWVANLPDMQFTLGLSGWTANDWSRAGQFDLLAPRASVDEHSLARVLAALAARWLASAEQLAHDTGLAPAMVHSALGLLTQAGRVMFDLAQGVYRWRELTREPLPLASLRFASAQEEKAAQLLAQGTFQAGVVSKIAVPDGTHNDPHNGSVQLQGRAKDNGRSYAVSLTLNSDLRIVAGRCECDFFIRNRLYRGPCEHMLALRMHDGGGRT